VPSGLHWDNATEQKSHIVTQLNREYEVKEPFAEAGYPNQNPVESHGRTTIEPHRRARCRLDMGLSIFGSSEQLDGGSDFEVEVSPYEAARSNTGHIGFAQFYFYFIIWTWRSLHHSQKKKLVIGCELDTKSGTL
jgi:hypothetical protein